MWCNNHTSHTIQHWVPWQTLLPWLSGNFEKMMIVVPLTEWIKMEGKVIWGQTLSNARRQCDCVFMSVSFQCVILANVSRVIFFLGQGFVSLCCVAGKCSEDTFWARTVREAIAPSCQSCFWLWTANGHKWKEQQSWITLKVQYGMREREAKKLYLKSSCSRRVDIVLKAQC